MYTEQKKYFYENPQKTAWNEHQTDLTFQYFWRTPVNAFFSTLHLKKNLQFTGVKGLNSVIYLSYVRVLTFCNSQNSLTLIEHGI